MSAMRVSNWCICRIASTTLSEAVLSGSLSHLRALQVASIVCSVQLMSCLSRICCNVTTAPDVRKDEINDIVDATTGVIAEFTTILPAVPAIKTRPACIHVKTRRHK